MRSEMKARAPKRVVLLGGGHAHVEVVRQLGTAGLSADIILVSPSRYAPYSGMLPGYIAGQYGFEDFNIDLQALCQRSGITFREGLATGLEPNARRVQLEDGVWLDYDVLSVDIGSTPSLPNGISAGVSVKPIASFTERLGRLDSLAGSSPSPLRLAVVGQGVAGVEVALALKSRLDRLGTAELRAGGGVEIHLVGRSARLIPERGKMARVMVGKALSRRGIAHHPGFDVVAVENSKLIARDGRKLGVDEVDLDDVKRRTALVAANRAGAGCRWVHSCGCAIAVGVPSERLCRRRCRSIDRPPSQGRRLRRARRPRPGSEYTEHTRWRAVDGISAAARMAGADLVGRWTGYCRQMGLCRHRSMGQCLETLDRYPFHSSFSAMIPLVTPQGGL